MNRSDLLEMESTRALRAIPALELRASKDGDTLTYEGYASTTETGYDVYGGAPFGWEETIARGAFGKTLREGADVAFLINHEGLTLARTKSGTLDLREDKSGLKVNARLDARMNVVNDLQIAVERGDVDEMSFAFRVVRDEWFDERGEPSNEMVGIERRITEVSLDKGDVSAVNYGANPTTSGGFRNVDRALAELRSGKLTNETRRIISDFASSLDRATEITPNDVGAHEFEPTIDTGICKTCGQLASDHGIDVVDPQGTPGESKKLPSDLIDRYRELLALEQV